MRLEVCFSQVEPLSSLRAKRSNPVATVELDCRAALVGDDLTSSHPDLNSEHRIVYPVRIGRRVDAAFDLIPSAPAARAGVFTGFDNAGAGRAAD